MKDTPKARGFCNRMAIILDELAEDAEQLGANLCADPQITAGHMVQLQGIDLLAQNLRQLSEVLAADAPISAADNIRLDDLRSRLVAMTQIDPDESTTGQAAWF